jgi:iron complex transport system ATP-binding protein
VPKVHAQASATVVANLHDLNLAARFADRIVLLDQGKPEASGPPLAVLTEARLAFSFGIRARAATEEGRLPVVPQSPLPGA